MLASASLSERCCVIAFYFVKLLSEGVCTENPFKKYIFVSRLEENFGGAEVNFNAHGG